MYEPDVDMISSDAFKNNDKLIYVSIPNAKRIEENAFSGCILLNNLVLPGIDYDVNLFGSTSNERALISSLQMVEVCHGSHTIGTIF